MLPTGFTRLADDTLVRLSCLITHRLRVVLSQGFSIVDLEISPNSLQSYKILLAILSTNVVTEFRVRGLTQVSWLSYWRKSNRRILASPAGGLINAIDYGFYKSHNFKKRREKTALSVFSCVPGAYLEQIHFVTACLSSVFLHNLHNHCKTRMAFHLTNVFPGFLD